MTRLRSALLLPLRSLSWTDWDQIEKNWGSWVKGPIPANQSLLRPLLRIFYKRLGDQIVSTGDQIQKEYKIHERVDVLKCAQFVTALLPLSYYLIVSNYS